MAKLDAKEEKKRLEQAEKLKALVVKHNGILPPKVAKETLKLEGHSFQFVVNMAVDRGMITKSGTRGGTIYELPKKGQPAVKKAATAKKTGKKAPVKKAA